MALVHDTGDLTVMARDLLHDTVHLAKLDDYAKGSVHVAALNDFLAIVV